jgi:hypothetical protein
VSLPGHVGQKPVDGVFNWRYGHADFATCARRLLQIITFETRTMGIERQWSTIQAIPTDDNDGSIFALPSPAFPPDLYHAVADTPTPLPLLPQPQQKKRIRSKKPVSTLRNKELTTTAAGERLMSAYGAPFEASVFATWLMICWISTTRT